MATAVSAAIAATAVLPGRACADAGDPAVDFNPAFVRGIDGRPIDLSRFKRGDQVDPGTYRADVYLNQTWLGREDIVVRPAAREGESAVICLTRLQVARLGLNVDALPDAAAAKVALDSDGDCIDLRKIVPDAQLGFDLSTLRIDATIAQAYLKRTARGYVDPKDWDRGVTAGFVDYSANAYRTQTDGNGQLQYFLGLNTGVNVGNWRLRHNGNFSGSDGGGPRVSRYTALSTFAQRDVTSLKSQLTLGQYYTPADLFDSVSYTGVQLASDDRMLPDSQRGFAPIVRGTALTNASVTIRQGNNIVYQTNVAPGPFVIDDIYNTGYAGDLNVTVTEADGSVRSFLVPFATISQLRRAGASKFSVVAGKYRDSTLAHTPNFVEATYQRGFSNAVTGYAGIIAASHYQSVQAGIALSTSLGALAADVTFSKASGLGAASASDHSATGRSYRVSYSKLVDWTKTNFVVAAYRFSSPGYLSLSDYAFASNNASGSVLHQRNRFQTNLNQPLGGKWGSVYISGSAQNYWNSGKGSDISYQAGYSNNIGRVNLMFSAGRTLSINSAPTTQYMLTATLPLGRSPRAPYLSTSAAYSNTGTSNVQTGLSGSAGEASQFSYSVFGSHSNGNGQTSTSGGASAAWQAANAQLSGSFSAGQGYNQASLGLTGSIVAHPGGLSLTQQQGETRAVVEAKGASGAALSGSIGAAVGSNGYGVLAGLMPYRLNDVALDPKGTSPDVELEITSQSVAPRYGSVVLLKYPTLTGKPLLLTLRDESGAALPVGAEVLDERGTPLTLVGQGSRVFLHTDEKHGRLVVRWGESEDRQCEASYDTPDAAPTTAAAYLRVDAVCTSRQHVPLPQVDLSGTGHASVEAVAYPTPSQP